MNPTLRLMRRDLLLAYRGIGEVLMPLMFFIMVTALFPLALDPEPALLRKLAPGVIWVAALLAGLLAQDALFRHDQDDGTLEQLLLNPHSLELMALGKVFSHWLVSGLPLVIISPLMAMLLAFPAHAMPVLMVSLLLGTPVLSLLGAVGAALTVGLRREGMLVPILILPLTTPVLIFGARSAALAADGDPAGPPLYLLGSLLALAATLAPFAIAAALRISNE